MVKKAPVVSKKLIIILGIIIVIFVILLFLPLNNNQSLIKTIISGNKNKENQKLYFEKESYTCEVGESFETMIKLPSSSNPSIIKSYSISDTSLATIDTNTKLSVNCTDCLMVRVSCIKIGSTKIVAKTSNNDKAEAIVNVTR